MASPKLDLIFLDTHNLKLIGIVDSSFYPTGYRINEPSLEVTPPGFTRAIIPFQVSSLNLLNSHNLNMTCIDDGCGIIDLPDGLWNLKYTIAPVSTNFVEKTFLRVDALRAKFDSVFLHVDMKECDLDIKSQDMEKIDQIEAYINGAVAEANRCNYIEAMKRYAAASKLIDNFLKTK